MSGKRSKADEMEEIKKLYGKPKATPIHKVYPLPSSKAGRDKETGSSGKASKEKENCISPECAIRPKGLISLTGESTLDSLPAEKPNDLYWKARCAEAEKALAESEAKIKELQDLNNQYGLVVENPDLIESLKSDIAEKDKEIAALRKENYELMFHPVIEQKVEKALSAERGRLIKEIDASVAGCKVLVEQRAEEWIGKPVFHTECNVLPPEQKCQKCQGKLEIKGWLE